MNYSNEIKERVIALLRENRTAKQIKEETGISIPTINRWKKEAGLVRARQVDTKDSEDIEQELYIIELYQKHIEEMIEEADQNDDLDAVEQLCNELISLNSNNIEARKRLVKIAMMKGRIDYTESLCNEILDLNPDEVFAYEMLLQISKRRGDPETVKDIAQATIDVDYLNLPARRALLAIAKKEGNHEEAMRLMQEILILDPKDTHIRHTLIQIAMKENNLTMVNQLLQEAQQQNVMPSLEYIESLMAKREQRPHYITSRTFIKNNNKRNGRKTIMPPVDIDLFRTRINHGIVSQNEASETLLALQADNSIPATALKVEICLRIFNNPRRAKTILEQRLNEEGTTTDERRSLGKVSSIIESVGRENEETTR